MTKTFAITAGEPNSINSEIIAKCWNENKRRNYFIIGNVLLLKKQLSSLKINIPLFEIKSIREINNSKFLNIYNVPLNFKNPFNVEKVESSKYVLKCLDLAHDLAIKKLIPGFINCPIDKKKIFKTKNIGVTEYLANKNNLNKTEVMMIYNKKLAVVPITTHLSLKNVSKNINKSIIEKKIKTINNFYLKLIKRKPIIAVLGLNPHNNEMRVGSEENKIITPILQKLKKNNYKVKGPFAADTIFLNKKKYKYDVIVGMYHDQVLAPFKTLYDFDAINITLGLKYLRISPDHGIATDMIGEGKANHLSLLKAIEFFYKNKI
jgi:4-hydroxythreonine-4-phosphate dehydrogenase